MTLTELARLAELEDLLTVGLVEQPINGSVLSWGEAALIAHRIGRHLLRVTPVADTAGIDAAWRELPDGVHPSLHPHWGEAPDDEPVPLLGYRATAWVDEKHADAYADTPAAALLALAAALRTPKPEGDR